jgi:hypothetical protein
MVEINKVIPTSQPIDLLRQYLKTIPVNVYGGEALFSYRLKTYLPSTITVDEYVQACEDEGVIPSSEQEVEYRQVGENDAGIFPVDHPRRLLIRSNEPGYSPKNLFACSAAMLRGERPYHYRLEMSNKEAFSHLKRRFDQDFTTKGYDLDSLSLVLDQDHSGHHEDDTITGATTSLSVLRNLEIPLVRVGFRVHPHVTYRYQERITDWINSLAPSHPLQPARR